MIASMKLLKLFHRSRANSLKLTSLNLRKIKLTPGHREVAVVTHTLASVVVWQSSQHIPSKLSSLLLSQSNKLVSQPQARGQRNIVARFCPLSTSWMSKSSRRSAKCCNSRKSHSRRNPSISRWKKLKQCQVWLLRLEAPIGLWFQLCKNNWLTKRRLERSWKVNWKIWDWCRRKLLDT